MQEVIIEIDRTGNVKVEGKGFEGNECQQVTKEIEAALGTVTEVQLKPEFHRQKSRARTAAR